MQKEVFEFDGIVFLAFFYFFELFLKNIFIIPFLLLSSFIFLYLLLSSYLPLFLFTTNSIDGSLVCFTRYLSIWIIVTWAAPQKSLAAFLEGQCWKYCPHSHCFRIILAWCWWNICVVLFPPFPTPYCLIYPLLNASVSNASCKSKSLHLSSISRHVLYTT